MNLLNGAADCGKNVVSVRSDQSDCAYDYRQDDGQHDRVFRDVLPCFFPQAMQNTPHVDLPLGAEPETNPVKHRGLHEF